MTPVSMKNKQYYSNKNYTIDTYIDKDGKERVKSGTKIRVNVNDLQKASNVLVDIKCDYCNSNYKKSYYNYLKGHKIINKDCCNDKQCISKKRQETNLIVYGTTNTAIISNKNGAQAGRHKKYTIENLKEICFEKGYELNDDYLLSNHPLLKDTIHLICTKHSLKFESSIASLVKINSCNCPKCISEKMSEVQRKSTIEDVYKICKEKDYKLLTDYIRNCDDQVDYICNKHKSYGIQHTTLYGLQHYKNNCHLCKIPRQENHWHWEGGISSERDKIKSSIEYKTWRNLVFERDNYTCQCCGNYGVKLNAHHIYNFSDYPALRLDISNGITLCENCHSVTIKGSFHNIYTQFNNTPEQLEEYIRNYKLQN